MADTANQFYKYKSIKEFLIMSKLLIKMDEKEFSIYIPSHVAEMRFLELCSIAMQKKAEASQSPTEEKWNAPVKIKKPRAKNLTAVGSSNSPGPASDAPIHENSRPLDEEDEEDGESTIKGEPYVGFLHVVCEKCGATSSFCTKSPMRQFECHECGHITPLIQLGSMKLECECGKKWQYHTNAESHLVEVNCVACQSPMIGELDKHGNYVPLRDT